MQGHSLVAGFWLALQRFISRKTVDRVLKELRELTGGGSRPSSRASGSFSGSLSGPSGSGASAAGLWPSGGSVTTERR